MASGSLLTLSMSLIEVGGTTTYPPLGMVSNNVIGDRITVTLASGDNTCAIAPPPNSAGCVLIPFQVPNTATLGVRTAGVTNQALSHKGFAVQSWDTPPPELIINAAFTGSPQGSVEVIYF